METAILVALGLVVGLAIAGLAVFVARTRTPAEDPAAAQRAAEQATAAQLADQRIIELGARVQAMGELLAKAQTQLQSSVHERLDAVTQHLGTSVQNATRHTTENLQKLNERLAVIDNAQRNLTDLASQVTSLQSVLTNKQSRGAFGQARMESIVQDGLPKGAYEFQYTLSNRTRPDCCVFMPDKRPLVIDAKFPLEGVTAFREARSDDEKRLATQRLRQDVTRHFSEIADKYLIPGETHEMALMFVPSESVYAEIYDNFDDLVQKAYRARVVMVSPALLMLAIQVVQQIQKDARMREAADQIRDEVGHLMGDIGRLGDRVRKLQQHFNQSNEDVRQALISIEKIETRGERIRQVEVGELEEASDDIGPMRRLGAAE
ncbi:MAG: DNA recombination protein RmuC [Xanthobacteraceae bacterium]|nr:DNA recombination protein RmuC [Xanthobacteraceae bacterium]